MLKIDITDIAKTELLAKTLADTAANTTVIALQGELGTGKTSFTQFFCRALGVTGAVTSPSYVLLNEYRGTDYKIFHFDLYRLSSAEEALEIGLADFIDNGICLIEWFEVAEEFLPPDTIKINLEISKNKRYAYVQANPGLKQKIAGVLCPEGC